MCVCFLTRMQKQHTRFAVVVRCVLLHALCQILTVELKRKIIRSTTITTTPPPPPPTTTSTSTDNNNNNNNNNNRQQQQQQQQQQHNNNIIKSSPLDIWHWSPATLLSSWGWVLVSEANHLFPESLKWEENERERERVCVKAYRSRNSILMEREGEIWREMITEMRLITWNRCAQ